MNKPQGDMVLAYRAQQRIGIGGGNGIAAVVVAGAQYGARIEFIGAANRDYPLIIPAERRCGADLGAGGGIIWARRS